MQLRIDAPVEEVRAALVQALTAQEAEQFSVTPAPRDPFDPDDRGEAITFMTVVTFVALSAVGGVIGNATHNGLKRVGAILTAKFGKDRVIEDQAPEANDAPET